MGEITPKNEGNVGLHGKKGVFSSEDVAKTQVGTDRKAMVEI